MNIGIKRMNMKTESKLWILSSLGALGLFAFILVGHSTGENEGKTIAVEPFELSQIAQSSQ